MTTKRPRGRPAHPDLLTPAEWRVVEGVRHGMSNREIAQRRGISLDAVKYHVVNACQKLGLNGRARTWYVEVLGLPHLYSFGDLAFFDCGGVRLFLSQGESDGHSILYFHVPDIHAAHSELSARGAVFVGAPHMIHRHEDGTEEWMAFFNDNDGRPLAIMAQVKA